MPTFPAADISIARRDTLRLLGGIGALSALTPDLTNAASTSVALTNPRDRMRTYMLMRGALDDRLVIHWLQGRYYGLVEGEATPLFGIVSAQVSRSRPDNAGGYAIVRGEVSFMTNADTGEVVREILNPYTGAVVAVPTRGYPPSLNRIRPDLSFEIPQQPGATLRHEVQGIVAKDGDVWISELSTAKTPVPNSKPSLYNEMLTYHAKAADLKRRDIRRVPCEISFTNTVSWRSWMNMADHPGHLLAVGAGAYVNAIDELPIVWLRAARAENLPFLNDPLGFLAPVWIP
jgi:hypothetical protein